MSQPDQHTDRKEFLTRDEVTSAISALMQKVSTQTNSAYEKVVHDLFDLAAQIDALYEDLTNVQPQQIKAAQIKSAHDELSAIVEQTQGATFSIIGEAEKMEKIIKSLPPESAGPLTDSITRIYEACGFQDLTGQRIKKIVSTLCQIEERVDGLIVALGGSPEDVRKKADVNDETTLLNGPALPGQSISQEEIDKLLGF